MDNLTPRQRQVLRFIQDALAEHGMPPTRRRRIPPALAHIRSVRDLTGRRVPQEPRQVRENATFSIGSGHIG